MLTLPDDPVRERTDRPAIRPFRVAVKSIRRLSPSFLRVTFAGDELDVFGGAGLDQRIKLVLPLERPGAPRGFDHLGLDDPEMLAAGGWFERWRQAPEDVRNPLRTYTVRSIRQDARELDVDFAVHGDGGPASRWVRDARPGDELMVIGPDDRSTGYRLGIDWRPGECGELLLVGDETAVPAACAILESLGPGVRATAFLEVPESGDVLDVELAAPQHRIVWLPRDGAERGEQLVPRVRDWVQQNRSTVAPRPQASVTLDESDVEAGLVWDAPAEPEHAGF